MMMAAPLAGWSTVGGNAAPMRMGHCAYLCLKARGRIVSIACVLAVVHAHHRGLLQGAKQWQGRRQRLRRVVGPWRCAPLPVHRAWRACLGGIQCPQQPHSVLQGWRDRLGPQRSPGGCPP